MVVEDLEHLLAALDEEALPVESEALRVLDVRGRPDAEQRVVVVVVARLEVVRIVRDIFRSSALTVSCCGMP
jgi:hypothetical protein